MKSNTYEIKYLRNQIPTKSNTYEIKYLRNTYEITKIKCLRNQDTYEITKIKCIRNQIPTKYEIPTKYIIIFMKFIEICEKTEVIFNFIYS